VDVDLSLEVSPLQRTGSLQVTHCCCDMMWLNCGICSMRRIEPLLLTTDVIHPTKTRNL